MAAALPAGGTAERQVFFGRSDAAAAALTEKTDGPS